MDLTIFIVTVFCLIDDWLKPKRLRQRGPQPLLSDSEVLSHTVAVLLCQQHGLSPLRFAELVVE